MNFEVDRYSSAWARIALCADLTWATEDQDEFIIANQRLWAQHSRVSQIFQETYSESQSVPAINKSEATDKQSNTSQNQEIGSNSGKRSVKDVIPESRLAQYGNFYYDDIRENGYTNENDKTNGRGNIGQACDNCDLTECWMLPEVEYWYKKLVDESSERGAVSRRRRQYRIPAEDDFERWGPSGEEALAARVLAVRALWGEPRAPSPPAPSRKMRARRRPQRRPPQHAPPLPHCLEAAAPLLCDPSCKFQFEVPRPPDRAAQIADCQRAIGRISASVHAALRASAPYRGTTVSRYAPTSQRPRHPERRGVWWPRDHPSPRLERFRLVTNTPGYSTSKTTSEQKTKEQTDRDTTDSDKKEDLVENTDIVEEKVVEDEQPSTSSALESCSRNKRLYSTVLSTAPISLTQVACVRLSQKLAPGLLKLNPKIVLPAARIRQPNVENKFEELEKEALEQYKASDESLDTTFQELEKQAEEQYSTTNSNTSCSSGNSGEKGTSTSPSSENDQNPKLPTKFPKEIAVDSVVIYSQNFPDLSNKHTTSTTNLKNLHTPQRGEKQLHRSIKTARGVKSNSQKAASDTDNDTRENSKAHKGPMRWTVHAVPPKKRHLSLCVLDFSSDEDMVDSGRSLKSGQYVKNHTTGKIQMSAHGGGDLKTIVRKT